MWYDYINDKWMPGQMYTGTGGGTYPDVQYYADLPAAADHSGEVYLVTTETVGDWWTAFLNKKPAGLYQSNGSAWIRLPNNLYLYSLGDTNITSSNIADLKILGYNATSHVWEPKTLADLGVSLAAIGNTDTRIAPAAGAAGTVTLDLSLGRSFEINCDTNTTTSMTIELSNVPTGTIRDGITVCLITGAGTVPTVTWPQGVTAPTLAASKELWVTLATKGDANAVRDASTGTTRLFSAGSF